MKIHTKILSMPARHAERSEFIDLWFPDELSAEIAACSLQDAEIFDFEDRETFTMLKIYLSKKVGWRIYDQETALMAKLYL